MNESRNTIGMDRSLGDPVAGRSKGQYFMQSGSFHMLLLLLLCLCLIILDNYLGNPTAR
jgi:hypothetical protein